MVIRGRGAAIAAAVVLAALAGCTTPRSGPDTGPESRPAGSGVGRPGTAQVVALYQVGGGFTTVTWSLMEGPRLVVTRDGVAVADSRRHLTLGPDELADLLAAQREDLRGLGPTPPGNPSRMIADAPTTRLEVALADGTTQSVSAYALSEDLGHPAKLLAARDRMERLAVRVLREGTPYTADRVRLVIEPVPDELVSAGEVVPWPERVEVPEGTDMTAPARVVLLDGADAATAASLLPGDDWRGGDRTLLRVPGGDVVAVAWRYLTVAE
jgi:hypothetical protein